MIKLYNTLTKKIEEFIPLEDNKVAMYSCGPTVYDYQHIGHMRRYVGDDILVRLLLWNDFDVKHVMNITDVGHLVSDSDEGEDKMEKGAKKFGMSVWDIARKFEKQFFDSTDALHIMRPDVLMHATDYIDEQIDLIAILEKKGYTYTIADGVYFDTSKFPDYFKLSRQNPEELKKGARVEFIEDKKHISDFALWKFSPKGEKRQMEWESPWGVGFPGWHIECSAMAMDQLGATLDVHTGGIDHIPIHHTNEIAQSECATGKQFVRYWVHHNFLVVDGQKMSKSLGNFYTVQDVVTKGYDPMSLRYLYLQTHYRQEMNFTWNALDAASTAYKKLVQEIYSLKEKVIEGKDHHNGLDAEAEKVFEQRFIDALNEDMNTAKALSVMWEVIHSHLPTNEKITALSVMDNLLGLRAFEKELEAEQIVIPAEVTELVAQRETFRQAKDFAASDELRDKIIKLGYELTDTPEGPKITKR